MPGTRCSHFALFVTLAISSFQTTLGQVVSERTFDSATADWFSPAESWDNGVPNGLDAQALALFLPGLETRVNVDQPLTLQSLEVNGGLNFVLAGSHPVTFASATDVGTQLFVGAAEQSLRVAFANPLNIGAENELIARTPAGATLHLERGLTASSGDLRIVGVGNASISNSLGTWAGNLVIDQAIVQAATTLDLGNSTAGTEVKNGGQLSIMATTAEPFFLSDARLVLGGVDYTGPISIADENLIHRNKNRTVPNPLGGELETIVGDTDLRGAITGSGGLVLRNDSRDPIILWGDNSYSGPTVIDGGSVQARSPTALGAAEGNTVIRAGTLFVQVASQESFQVDGGNLVFGIGAFAPSDPIDLAAGVVSFQPRDAIATPLHLNGVGGEIRFANAANWSGGSTGSGALNIVGAARVNGSLNHEGNLVVSGGAELNAANNYTGDTRLANVTVNHEGAFGSSPTVHMENSVTINARQNALATYFVHAGTLEHADAVEQVDNPIVITGDEDVILRGNVHYNGPITVHPVVPLPKIEAGSINGPLFGNAMLELGSDTPLFLNAPNNYQGSLRIVGNVTINHGKAANLDAVSVVNELYVNAPVTGNPFISGGRVVFQKAQDFSGPWVQTSGTLNAAEDVAFDSLIVLPSRNGANLESDGGVIRIDEELRVMGNAAVDGSLAGNGAIRLIGRSLSLRGDASQFTGVVDVLHGSFRVGAPISAAEIRVEATGRLQVSGEQPLTSPVIVRQSEHDRSVRFRSLETDAYTSDQAPFQGLVDVGDLGTVVGGNLEFEEGLKGANVVFSYGRLSINTPMNELRGAATFHQVGVTLGQQGELNAVRMLDLRHGSSLTLGPSPSENRIADAVAVHLSSASMFVDGNVDYGARETLGTVIVEAGGSRAIASFGGNDLPTNLTINDLQRREGGILQLFAPDPDGTISLPGAQTVVGGMIGAWAVTDDGFAAVDHDNNVTTLAATAVSIAASAPDDHVFLQDIESLQRDHVIYSLQFERQDEPLDLNGHLLTVVSGGVFRSSEIYNGRLSAGSGAAVELILHEGFGIPADIVDHPEGGAVTLVAANSDTRLTGANSYSGGTHVSGKDSSLRIDAFQAVPSRDRVFVNDGVYDISHLPSGVVELSEIHLRGGGTVRGGAASLDADLLFLEEGMISTRLAGDGKIVKRTDGIVNFSAFVHEQYHGEVVIEEGLFIVDEDTFPAASVVVQGGEYRGGADSDLTLNGGALGEGVYNGNIYVQSDSSLLSQSRLQHFGELHGSGNLTIFGRDQSTTDEVWLAGEVTGFYGNIKVESGTLRIGSANFGSDGEVHVEEAGRLLLTSRLSHQPVQLQSDVFLSGGQLISAPRIDEVANIVSGHIVVEGEAFLGAERNGMNERSELTPGLILSGELDLPDNARVFGSTGNQGEISFPQRPPIIEVAGELRVGENTTWHILGASVGVTGRIVPLSANSSIDFVGMPNLLSFQTATLVAQQGKSLQVTINGGEVPVVLSGSESQLTGNGRVIGDFDVAAGASISPGASPGELIVDGRLNLGPGGALQIELGGTDPSRQYDVLRATEPVSLDRAVLDVVYLNDFLPSPEDAFIVLTAPAIHGRFVNAEESVLVNGVELPVTYLKNMIVLGNASTVPEPSSLIVISLGALVSCIGKRGRSANRPGAMLTEVLRRGDANSCTAAPIIATAPDLRDHGTGRLA